MLYAGSVFLYYNRTKGFNKFNKAVTTEGARTKM
jgi:hypothetical protein